MTEKTESRLAREIKDTAEEYGLNYRNSYSGRFMYGETCVGVVGDDSEFLDFWAALEPEIREEIGKPTTDSMGLNTIWYWPGVAGGPDLEEDDEE